ncbi:MAG: flavodoxin family protein [Firmicutes bacterium]|nr:flavodoxin family protein [Bacillota bacterium]
MNVMLVNGSPHKEGCTYTALMEIHKTLAAEGIASQVFQLGVQPISGCIACGRCAGKGECAIDDAVNRFIRLAKEADGFIFGSPVHYAAASGSLTAFMDRAFFAADKSIYYLKPAACILSARRAGTTAAFDQLNKYFTINQMPVISSRYWNMVHGSNKEQVGKDLEGLQTMRILARNMAWFLRCKEAGAKAGVPLPQQETPIFTNFIR